MKLLGNRIYKSGTGIKWCFWRWSDAQEPYLTRLFLFKTPWFAASLNWIKQADSGDPHDHTSAFLSIFIYGWYVERRIIRTDESYKDFIIKRRFWNYMRGVYWDAHRILEVSEGGMLTLCLMGPKVRDWSYHLPDGTRQHWMDYKENQDAS